MSDELPATWDDIKNYAVTAAPGIGAAVLSVYNFLQNQKGANLHPVEFLNFGIISPAKHHHTSEILDNKTVFYFPVLINNTGIKPGSVKNVQIIFTDLHESNQFKIDKRVEFNSKIGVIQGQNVSEDQFIDVFPQMPITVPPKDGITLIFRGIDWDNEVVPIDTELKCSIVIKYGLKKKKIIEFNFKLYSEDYENARNKLNWIEIESTSIIDEEQLVSDKVFLREMFEEIERPEIYEKVLNRPNTRFSRKIEHKGLKFGSLDLSNLKLNSISPSISKINQLKQLNLNNNFLKYLPSEIQSIESLEDIKLKKNYLEDLNFGKFGLSTLKRLDASENNIHKLESTFSNLINLNHLTLNNNSLMELPSSFSSLNSLKTILLSENKLTSFPIQFPENIEKIRMNANEITHISESIKNYKQLKYLDISNNKLTSLPKELFELENLVYLDLQGNNLTSIPDNIGQLKKLELIDLSQNELTSLPMSFGDLENLTNVHFGKNKLTDIPDDFYKLKKVNSIGYNDNEWKEKIWEGDHKFKQWYDSVDIRSANTGLSKTLYHWT